MQRIRQNSSSMQRKLSPQPPATHALNLPETQARNSQQRQSSNNNNSSRAHSGGRNNNNNNSGARSDSTQKRQQTKATAHTRAHSGARSSVFALSHSDTHFTQRQTKQKQINNENAKKRRKPCHKHTQLRASTTHTQFTTPTPSF